MKVVAFFLIALVATSYASQTLFKNLAKISKDPTGAAILAAISLNVKAKVPTDDIGALLNDLLSDLLNQSQVFEAATASENDQLTSSIASEQALDATYQATIQTLQGTIDNAQSSLATAQDSLANNQQALADEQQGIQDRDADAAVVVPELNDEIQGLQDAIAATEEAGQKMQAYKQSSEGSASFIQMGTSIKDKIKKVTTSIQSMKKKLAKHSNMFTPLVRELIDLSSSLDQSKADRVISLLQEIHDNLVQALNDTENRKATYVSNYNDRQAQAQQNVANYEAVIDQLQQTISGLQDKIAQAQSDLATTQDLAAQNQASLSAHQARLESLQADYAVRRPRFDRLIALVRQVIAYFEQNLQGVDDYVTQSIDTL